MSAEHLAKNTDNTDIQREVTHSRLITWKMDSQIVQGLMPVSS